MDKITIETEATSAFKTIIRRNPYLSSYIDENDKTPVWDGSVYVYSTENTVSNKALIGRVPTQIKGHNANGHFPSEIKFQIEKTNLRAFQSEGGAIFIVVYINDKFETQIYYEQLLSLDIERLLSKLKMHESISVNFKQIPQDNVMLANLFLNFIRDRQKQTSTVDKTRLHFSDWENNKDIGTYSIHISTVNSSTYNPLQALSMSTVYLYGKPADFNFEIPVERVNSGMITTKNMHSIGCDGKVYFAANETTSIWIKGNLIIKFGQAMSFELFFLKGNRISGRFHYDLVGSLNNRLNDAEFVLTVLENNEISINGVPLKFDNLGKGTLDGTIKLYNDLKLIREKLNQIGVFQDFDIHKIDAEEKWKINLLMEINEDYEDVYLSPKHQIFFLSIANIQLTVITFLRDSKLFVRDYFSEMRDLMFSVNSEKGEEYIISRFLHLKENALVSSNMYAEPVYLDIIKYDTWEDYQITVNLFLLECIKAYDSNRGNHAELYKLSLMIAEWLRSKDSNSAIYNLNYFQILIRTRLLTSDEKSLLYQLSISDDETWSVKCGAFILCGDNKQAQELLIDRSVEEQAEFKSYPIYNLFRVHMA